MQPQTCRRTVVFEASMRTESALGVIAALLIFAATSVDAGAESERTTFAPYSAEPRGIAHTVSVMVQESDAELRAYVLSSTAPQRDQGSNERTVREEKGGPRVRTGSLLFDALFAQAVNDLRLNSVNVVRDGSYADGQPIDCRCFQTGEFWAYVWTRDLAYAADLGLADFDVGRTVNSLLFKTSGFREGVAMPVSLPIGSGQIVQDTGSGGSWPISTDRTAWALGARAALANLAGPERESFAARTYAVLVGTLEADREAAFDPNDGLYGGEQSFLDWRVQTYAPWIVNDLSHMAASKALSTNVVQYQALRLAEQLGSQQGDAQRAQRFAGWADGLKRAINEKFWLADLQMYASLTTSTLRAAPIYKFDMLGTALAVISGVADQQRAKEIIARYPHAPFGVPVYYPQQPDEYVYHNRAIWPFVTAYELKAAARVGNSAVAGHAVESLMRAAALNLSNMENLEWLTGKAQHEDGPRINSRRQLWSVGAYLGMVAESIFGYHVEDEGLRIQPFLTTAAHRLMGGTDRATLSGLSYQGRPLTIVLQLPPTSDMTGFYPVASVTLNGSPVTGPLSHSQLSPAGNIVEVRFGVVEPGDTRLARIPQVSSAARSDARVFSPRAPEIDTLSVHERRVTLTFTYDSKAASDPVTFNVYRDGALVSNGLRENTWRDPLSSVADTRVCYTVEAVFVRSRNRSHHSQPACHDDGAIEAINADDPRMHSAGTAIAAGGGIERPTLRRWEREPLVLAGIDIESDGSYVIQVIYDNRENDISTGVTNAVKRVRLFDAGGVEAARGIVQMPHINPAGGGFPLRASTELRTRLKRGRYRLHVEDYFNMSYLRSNSLYSAAGGRGGPINAAGIAEIRLIRVALPAAPFAATQ